MPDPNQPINPTQTTDPTTPGMPVVEEITIPTMSQSQQSAPPPPPSDVPPPDLPPVVPPVITLPPAKKFGGRRVIATILGLLVLGGGLTAGLILVRQQQIFREKAREFCGECTSSADCGEGLKCEDTCCVAPPPPAQCGSGEQPINCAGGIKCIPVGSTEGCEPPPPPPPSPPPPSQCGSGEQLINCADGPKCISVNSTEGCPPPPPPPPPTSPGGSYCRLDRECDTSIGEKCVSHQCTIPPPAPAPYCSSFMFQDCAYGCEPTLEGGRCKASQSTAPYCSSFNYQDCAYGCEPTVDGGRCKAPSSTNVTNNGCNTGWHCDKIYTEGTTCQETWSNSIQQPCSLTSNDTAKSGTCCIPPLSAGGPTPKPGGGGPPVGGGGTPLPAGVTAQCLNIKAFDTNWTQITNLSTLKVGDKVRFTVAGSASTGTFDRARFTVNGALRPEVTATRPGTSEFYDEYTIPEGTSSFSINAQVHNTVLGWF